MERSPSICQSSVTTRRPTSNDEQSDELDADRAGEPLGGECLAMAVVELGRAHERAGDEEQQQRVEQDVLREGEDADDESDEECRQERCTAKRVCELQETNIMNGTAGLVELQRRFFSG